MSENIPNESNSLELKESLSREKLERLETILYNLILGFHRPHEMQNDLEFLKDSVHLVLKNESNLLQRLSRIQRDFTEIKRISLKAAETDKLLKFDLKSELEKAWKQAIEAKNAERKMRETVSLYRSEINYLTKLIEQEAGIQMGQERSLRDVLKEKELVEIKNQMLLENLETLRSELDEFKKKNSDLLESAHEAKIAEERISQSLLDSALENKKLIRKIEQIQEEIADQKRLNDTKDSIINRLNESIKELKSELNRQEKAMKESRLENERLEKEHKLQVMRNQSLINEAERRSLTNQTLQSENKKLELNLKDESRLIDRLRSENAHVHKSCDSLEQKIRAFEEERSREANERKLLEIRLEQLNRDMCLMTSEKEASLAKEKSKNDEFNKLHVKLEHLQDTLEEKQNELDLIKIELSNIKKENKKLKEIEESSNQMKSKYEVECDKLKSMISELRIKIDGLIEKIKSKDISLEEISKNCSNLKRKLEEANKKLKDSERKSTRTSMQLMKTKQDLEIVKQLAQNSQSEEQNLKMRSKEEKNALKKLNQNLSAIENRRDHLAHVCYQRRIEVEKLEEKIEKLDIDEKQLVKAYNQTEIKFIALKKAYDVLFYERNVLGSMLVRRNDEISLLREEQRLIKNILRRGQMCYERLEENLRRKSSEISMLRKEVDILKLDKIRIKELTCQLTNAEMNKVLEQAKRNALEEKLTNQNIHRWRFLSGNDPNTYELMSKVRILQNRLIARNEEIREMRMKFDEKDRLFAEMKRYFIRNLVTEETADKILIQKNTLNERQRKIKALLAENKMLSDELNKLKEKRKVNM